MVGVNRKYSTNSINSIFNLPEQINVDFLLPHGIFLSIQTSKYI
jgi:hypothetical protein